MNKQATTISAIVLAAGLSRRMGSENKLLLKFKTESILKTTIRNLLAADVDEIIVVLGHEADLVAEEIKEFKVKSVLNPTFQNGMNGSIKKGINTAGENANAFMICLADQPLISSKVYNTIIENFKHEYSKDNRIIQVPYFKSHRGNPACFSAIYKDKLMNNPSQSGARQVIEENIEKMIKITLDEESILLDIDYPNDLIV